MVFMRLAAAGLAALVLVLPQSHADALQERARALFAPVPEAAPVSAAQVQLGRKLFFDPRLAADGRSRCSACHDLRRGGASGRPVDPGHGPAEAQRNTPTVLNAGLNQRHYWAGTEAGGAADLAAVAVRALKTYGGDDPAARAAAISRSRSWVSQV